MIRIAPRLILASTVTLVVTFAHAQPENASSRVKEPPIPPRIAERGVAYHTITGGPAQVTFTSDAPLENIVGKSNAVVGYAVAGPDAAPARLAGAEWVLPVRTLATGIPLRDEHLAADEWLDADDFPTIHFKLESTEDATLVKSGDGFTTWSVTLVGTMTMHGVTRPLRVKDARLSFLHESPKTASIAKGDLMFLKCAYEVKMSDFGIKHHDVPDKVSDAIALTQMIRMSTVRAVDGA